MRPDKNQVQKNDANESMKSEVEDNNYFWLEEEFAATQACNDTVPVVAQSALAARIRQNANVFPEPEVRLPVVDGKYVETNDPKDFNSMQNSVKRMSSIECNYAMLKEKIQIAYDELEKSKQVRSELERELRAVYNKYEAVRHEYDNTMRERKEVLEENERLMDENTSLTQQVNRLFEEKNRLFEEKDRLENELHHLTNNKGERQIQQLRHDLVDVRHSLYLNMEEALNATKRGEAAKEEIARLQLLCQKLEKERNEALLKLNFLDEEVAEDTVTDIWDTLTFHLNLPSASPNLGLILGGGKGDDIVGRASPIYIKEILPGSPFEPHLQRLDYISEVNGIEVAGMDQHSVTSILSNSKKLIIEVKRRNPVCQITDISLNDTSGKLGVEFETGVIISELRDGIGLDNGLCVGARLFHVNGIPVNDPLQAKALIQEHKKNLILGVAGRKWSVNRTGSVSSRTTTTTAQDKQPRTRILNKIHEKLFGRSGNEKTRAIIAQANLDACAGDLTTYRHGSLRIPSSRPNVFSDELVRTGSLRATFRSGDQRQPIPGPWADRVYHRQSQSHDDGTKKTWPKAYPEHMVGKQTVCVRPSITTVFSSTSSQQASGARKLPRVTLTTQCATQCSYPNKIFQSTPNSVCGTTARIVTSTNTLMQPKLIGVAHAQRISALPEPPPYPGQHSSIHPSIDSLSMASSNSYLVVPQSSSASFQHGYSPTETIHKQSNPDLPEEEKGIRCVVIRQDATNDDFGIELENLNGGVVISRVVGAAKDQVHVGEQLIDVNGVNMRLVDKDAANRVLRQLGNHNDEITLTVKKTKEGPRWVHANRKEVKLCGGNGVGILVEKRLGELKVGERILEIDGKDVRKATLEEARIALDSGQSEIVNVLCEYDGGARYERLHNGADPDSFYIKVNIDRAAKSCDELEFKKGEILYVDYTMFGNEIGKWRAWRIDHEGRQRQCGVIPSFARITEEETRRTRRTRGRSNENIFPNRFLYERVERVSSSQKRPLILFSAYVAPFMQTLIDEHGDKFAQCVAECLALNNCDARRAGSLSQFIEVRRREELFEVISVSALQQIIANGYHCVLDVAPQAVAKLRSMHLYPIFVRIKFKNVKQLREFAEECGNERLNNKTAKELMERAESTDAQLRNMECTVSTISVGSHHGRNAVRYVCHQIVATVEHEQKRSVWVPANCPQSLAPR